MMEVWMWKLTETGSETEVKDFPSKEEAEKYINLHRDGRNVVYVNTDEERGNVWRLIGAKCLMS